MRLKRGKWRGGATWAGIILGLVRLLRRAPHVMNNPGTFDENEPAAPREELTEPTRETVNVPPVGPAPDRPTIPRQTTAGGWTWDVE